MGPIADDAGIERPSVTFRIVEGGRNHPPVHIGPGEFNEIFLLPFEMVGKQANASS
ncbi:hypothetical protein QFZ97_002504 [Paraburkholderia youngii]